MSPEHKGGRDIIVIGGSAGALDPLVEIVRALDPHIAAAVMVVVHHAAESPYLLPDILAGHTRLPIRTPEDHEPIEVGTIYIAPPDRHLLVKAGELRAVRGPKENGFRPAIDPLFRTAANAYGNRVVGVLLSGMLDDGCHGLNQIRRQGGSTIVQDPQTAASPSMPRTAIEWDVVEHVVAPASIGELINDLATAEVAHTKRAPSDEVDVVEGLVDALRMEDIRSPSPFRCPDCGGPLWQIEDGPELRFRCHVGHGYTYAALSSMQTEENEQMLWSAIRVLEEQGELERRMADKWHIQKNARLSERFIARGMERQKSADLLRSIVTAAPRMISPPEPGEPVFAEYRKPELGTAAG